MSGSSRTNLVCHISGRASPEMKQACDTTARAQRAYSRAEWTPPLEAAVVLSSPSFPTAQIEQWTLPLARSAIDIRTHASGAVPLGGVGTVLFEHPHTRTPVAEGTATEAAVKVESHALPADVPAEMRGYESLKFSAPLYADLPARLDRQEKKLGSTIRVEPGRVGHPPGQDDRASKQDERNRVHVWRSPRPPRDPPSPNLRYQTDAYGPHRR